MDNSYMQDSEDNSENKAYAGCGCETCKRLDVTCKDCPDCSEDMGKSYTSDDEEMDKWDNMTKACWVGYTQRGMKEKDGRMVPNCVPVSKSDSVSKADYPVTEGDFVMAMTTEGPVVGQVEHVMREGGTYGQSNNPYSVNSTPENPAVAIRMLEEEDGMYYYTPYSIGALMSDVAKIPMPQISMEDYEDMEDMDKAAGYTAPAGASAAARKAIKFKEDGKANGAGTAVGWTRAGQLARGESLSLSTVKRMYSYFSRHEVDKKGKDWGSQENPSNGYIMWLAWGGDAGFSWSRGVVEREMDKALFANFGKDFSKPVAMTNIFKGVGIGSAVSWNSSGGRAEGKIVRLVRSGKYKVPGTNVTVNATEDDPVAVIRLYRDGKPTDITVAHKLKTLKEK